MNWPCCGKINQLGVLLFLALLLISTLAVIEANANDFYVSPMASPNGRGKRKNPWDLQTALGQPGKVKPGDTIWLRGGTYTRSSGSGGASVWTSSLTGTASNPIHVKQYPGERAILDGNSGTAQQSVLRITGNYCWYWDFEITNSHPVRTTTSGSSFPPDMYRWNAIEPLGVGIKLIHLVVHDNGNGICPEQGGANVEVYGCISYNNGWFSIADNDGLGHGFYIQNDTGAVKKFINNIVFNNYNLGFQAYGQGGAVSDIEFSRNIAFNSGSPQALAVGSRDDFRKANVYVGNGSI